MGLPASAKRIAEIIQPTRGVGVTPAARDSLRCTDLTIRPLQGERKTIAYADGGDGADEEYLSGAHARVEMRLPATPSGAAGTAPPYDAALRGCGFARIVSADPDQVEYRPADAALHERTTILHHIGGAEGHFQQIRDCRGNLTFDLVVGEAPFWSLQKVGFYADHVKALPPASDVSAWRRPLPAGRANTPLFKIGDHAPCMAEFHLTDGWAINHDDLVNCEDIFLGPRAYKGSALIECPKLSTVDYWRATLDGMVAPVLLEHGSGPGNILGLSMPRAQIFVGDYAERKGKLMLNLSFVFLSTEGGDDVIITFR